MSRPQLAVHEKKDERLTVRFRSRELHELLTQAELCGLSVSELVRRRSLQKRIVPVTDLKMISELRRIGGLIKHLFNETNGLYGRKTSELLNELHAAILRLGQRRENDR